MVRTTRSKAKPEIDASNPYILGWPAGNENKGFIAQPKGAGHRRDLADFEIAAAHCSLMVGENLAFGLVDVTDRPKYDLVNQVRSANIAVLQSLGLQ